MTKSNIICLIDRNSSSLSSWLHLRWTVSSESERLELNPRSERECGPKWQPQRSVTKGLPQMVQRRKNTRAYFNTWRSLTKTRWPAGAQIHTERPFFFFFYNFIWTGICCVCLENRRNWAWAPKDLQPKHRRARLEMRARADTERSTQLIQNIITRRERRSRSDTKSLRSAFKMQTSTHTL